MNNCETYFLGANSPSGFFSKFDQLEHFAKESSLFIIKGGPGTGKSGLMRKIAEHYYALGENIELIFCSSDPASLDAIILKDSNIAIADGTSPHTLEPSFPGAYEHIINLGDCWDTKKLLADKQEIKATTLENSKLHKKSSRYLKAYSAVYSDTYNIVKECCLDEKIKSFCKRIAHANIKPAKPVRPPKEKIRFLSAISPDGVIANTETLSTLCDKLFIVNDEFGVVSNAILSELRKLILKNGYDIISCFCPMLPNEKLEHIIIPQLKMAFCVSNSKHKLKFASAKFINSKRFISMDKLKLFKNRIKFNNTLQKELLSQSIKSLKEAKSVHDKLENFYINAMDYKKVDDKTKKTIEILDYIRKIND